MYNYYHKIYRINTQEGPSSTKYRSCVLQKVSQNNINQEMKFKYLKCIFKKPNKKQAFLFWTKIFMVIIQQKSSLQTKSILISLFCKKIAFFNVGKCSVSLIDTLGNISRTIFFSKLFLFLIDLTITTSCIIM